MLMRASRADDQEGANILLRHLSETDRSRLDSRLERIRVMPGNVLMATNEPLDAVYFPETAIVSIERSGGKHERIETGVIGRDGMVGWSALVGCTHASCNAVVRMGPGTILRISLQDILSACRDSGTLLAALLRFVEITIVQMSQAIVSHLRDPMERRVARWLLMRHDRVSGNELAVMHDEISCNLGVRRASVTDCLHVLEGEHLVRCFRGRIVIRDRTGLVVRADGSYGVAEALYCALIGPFGGSAPGFENAAKGIESRWARHLAMI
jgi:CRP-like cAMP-binding protein